MIKRQEDIYIGYSQHRAIPASICLISLEKESIYIDYQLR